MGKFAIKPLVIVTASLITAILVYLNIRMVFEQAGAFFETSSSVFWKAVILFGGIFYIVLLIVAIFYPLRKKIIPASIKQLHSGVALLDAIEAPVYNKIAIALDFSKDDARLIAHAIGQGNNQTHFILIHVVESATTRLMEKETDDLETRKDQEQLEHYVLQLKEKGHQAKGFLGFNERAKEIARIARESGADMLVIGAHGHSGIRDIIYGQTVDAVRHELKIPVLVVNV